MIYRKCNINPTRKEVSFCVAYGPADVRRWMKDFILTFPSTCNSLEGVRSYVFSESDLRHWMEQSPDVFYPHEQPWRSQLCTWLIRKWLENGYFDEGATTPGKFYLSSKAFETLPAKLRKSSL